MKITILEAIVLMSSSSGMNESIQTLKESNTFKTLMGVKKQINSPNDVYKFMQKNKSKIEGIKTKSSNKVKDLFCSCVDKMNYCMSKGHEFIKKHWGKALFLICIISLGIFAYNEFKDKSNMITSWFKNDDDGIKTVTDRDDFDPVKAITSDTKVNDLNDRIKATKISSGANHYDAFDKNASTNDYLKSFYGDDASKIEKDAVKMRMKGQYVPDGARAFNTTIRTKENPESEYHDARQDPFKNISMYDGRPNAHAHSLKGNKIKLSRNTDNWGDIDHQVDHEVGHHLSFGKLGAANKRIGKPDDLQDTIIGYAQGDDDELGVALGGIRRYVYKNTNGAVDTAKPEDFQKVIANPEKYNLRGEYLQRAHEIFNLQNYKGSNKTFIKRRDQLKQRFEDPEYMGQFVDNSNHKDKNIA